jgi:ABC-type multidrug transport system, ATPase component
MRIEVKNVSKSFNEIGVLKDVDVEFEDGKIYGLLGPNGSGKSVFLKMLCGYYKPTNGRILFDGQDIAVKKIFSQRKRDLIERSKFFPNITGYENLKMVARIKREIFEENILIALKNVNLLDVKDQKIKEYSDGMKHKLAIAQVLMDDSKIIILDEPFGGLDDRSIEELSNLLVEAKYRKKIIILAVASKRDIEKIADIIYEFKCGKLEVA